MLCLVVPMAVLSRVAETWQARRNNIPVLEKGALLVGARWLCPSSPDPRARLQEQSWLYDGRCQPSPYDPTAVLWATNKCGTHIACIRPWHSKQLCSQDMAQFLRTVRQVGLPAGHSQRQAEWQCWNVKDRGDRWLVSLREQSIPWPWICTAFRDCFVLRAAARVVSRGHAHVWGHPHSAGLAITSLGTWAQCPHGLFLEDGTAHHPCAHSPLEHQEQP